MTSTYYTVKAYGIVFKFSNHPEILNEFRNHMADKNYSPIQSEGKKCLETFFDPKSNKVLISIKKEPITATDKYSKPNRYRLLESNEQRKNTFENILTYPIYEYEYDDLYSLKGTPIYEFLYDVMFNKGFAFDYYDICICISIPV